MMARLIDGVLVFLFATFARCIQPQEVRDLVDQGRAAGDTAPTVVTTLDGGVYVWTVNPCVAMTPDTARKLADLLRSAANRAQREAVAP